MRNDKMVSLALVIIRLLHRLFASMRPFFIMSPSVFNLLIRDPLLFIVCVTVDARRSAVEKTK